MHLFETHQLESELESPELVTFDGPEVSFRVNQAKRTISGLIVPWGAVATDSGGIAQWRFTKDSLYWSDTGRVKLNLYHDRQRPIGRAVRLQSTQAGLDGTFAIARGEEGDRALSLAEDGVLDGFSIEPHFGEGDGWKPDPSDRRIRQVSRARLVMVGLVPAPAFDDARVLAVTAAQQEGVKMAETKTDDQIVDDGRIVDDKGDPSDPGAVFDQAMAGLADRITESHTKLTEELAASVGESISAGIKVALENLPAPQQGPEPVRAARYAVTREAPVYTFDGRGPSLVRDAWYAQKEHDSEAQERIRRFHNQSAEVQKIVADRLSFMAAEQAAFATVDTTSASDIIPPGYRPDLFVPQLAQGRPLVNLLSRGTIANATPFVVPIFGSATGMTGDHTEGDPPTEGILAFDVKTVTPGAISGKLPLTREIVDSSNPAIDQIALAAMREDYSQQSEQKVYAALNGAGPAGNTEEFAATDSAAGTGAVYDARKLLARYPFSRFASPNGAAINQKVTEDFADAKDTTGRPLLPSVGAQNTAGLGNAVTQGWFVDGLAFVPAWAITDELSDDVALIVNSADVWAWESPVLAFRFEEKQGPEIIELALFGYFATHVLRPAGIFALRNPAA